MLTQPKKNLELDLEKTPRLLQIDQRALLLKTGLVILAILAVSPTVQIPGRDSGVFMYIGKGLLEGKIPYRDIWDHKPPLIYFIDALGLIISGGQRWGVWLMEVIALVMATLLSFQVLRPRFGLVPTAFAVLGSLLTLIYILQGDNFTEEYGLALQWIALALFMWVLTKQQFGLGGLGLGLTFGLTFFLKQNVVTLWLSLGFYLVVYLGLKRDWRRIIKFLGTFSLSAGGVTVVIVGYFVINNSLDFFVDSAFRYNFSYATSTFEARLTAIVSSVQLLAQSRVSTIALFSWPVALIYLYRHRRALTFMHALLIVAMLDLPLEFISSSLSGRIYSHYFISMLPSLAILNAFFFYLMFVYWIPGFNHWLFTRQNRTATTTTIINQRNRLLSVAILFPFLAVMWFVPIVFLYSRYFPPPPNDELSSNQATIEYINQHTQPTDYVLMWGAETSLNVVTGRPSPTRFVYQYPLFNYPARREEFVHELLQNLQTHPPTLIIDSTPAGGNETNAPLEEVARRQWVLDYPGQPIPANLQIITDYVQQEYHVVAQLGQQKWTVYARNK